MASTSNQSLKTGYLPLPAGSTQNPIRASYPRQLVIHDGDWKSCTDKRVLAGMDYLAVSYRQNDFPDRTALEKMVRNICVNKGIEAYWIDFACTGETQEEKNEDLYRIADVFRNAKVTLIVIMGEDNIQTTLGWRSWGERIWTFPEALLSKTFLVQAGLAKRSPKEMSLKQVANHAYNSDNESESKLMDLYSHMGKDFSEVPDRVEMLCEAIWKRSSGPDVLVGQSSSILTAYPGEKVYALMGFLLHRIEPDSSESEDDAFKRLMNVNKLEFGCLPRIAIRENGSGRIGLRTRVLSHIRKYRYSI